MVIKDGPSIALLGLLSINGLSRTNEGDGESISRLIFCECEFYLNEHLFRLSNIREHSLNENVRVPHRKSCTLSAVQRSACKYDTTSTKYTTLTARDSYVCENVTHT